VVIGGLAAFRYIEEEYCKHEPQPQTQGFMPRSLAHQLHGTDTFSCSLVPRPPPSLAAMGGAWEWGYFSCRCTSTFHTCSLS